MMRSTLVICCVLFSTTTFAQALRMGDSLAFKQPIGTFARPTKFTNKVGQPIPQDYYTKGFGFFCKQELKMQEAHVPLAFRLGSMDYCNWLEQKPGYR